MVGMAAALAGATALGTTPASAAGAGAFVGTAVIACFGCGTSTGTAALCWIGAYTGPPPTVGLGCSAVVTGSPNVTATYTVQEDGGVNCVITGTATGTTTGAVDVAFNWTRVGAVAVISTTGDINGAGVAAFVVTSPVGLPCGARVQAQVVGAIAGA
jgi:hypothetical protein